LLSNGIKFTNEGTVSVAVQRKDASHIVVSVKDTGTGIDLEILPRLFSKFATISKYTYSWIMDNGKPKKTMHDNDKQFTSKLFKHFLYKNNIKDKPIPNSYPQLQGKIEAYNKIV
jgi:transposase InsO family protein